MNINMRSIGSIEIDMNRKIDDKFINQKIK